MLSYPVDNILLPSIDNTDPAMFKPDAGAIKDLPGTGTRVHDIQLCQHTCKCECHAVMLSKAHVRMKLGHV